MIGQCKFSQQNANLPFQMSKERGEHTENKEMMTRYVTRHIDITKYERIGMLDPNIWVQ